MIEHDQLTAAGGDRAAGSCAARSWGVSSGGLGRFHHHECVVTVRILRRRRRGNVPGRRRAGSGAAG